MSDPRTRPLDAGPLAAGDRILARKALAMGLVGHLMLLEARRVQVLYGRFGLQEPLAKILVDLGHLDPAQARALDPDLTGLEGPRDRPSEEGLGRAAVETGLVLGPALADTLRLRRALQQLGIRRSTAGLLVDQGHATRVALRRLSRRRRRQGALREAGRAIRSGSGRGSLLLVALTVAFVLGRRVDREPSDGAGPAVVVRTEVEPSTPVEATYGPDELRAVLRTSGERPSARPAVHRGVDGLIEPDAIEPADRQAAVASPTRSRTPQPLAAIEAELEIDPEVSGWTDGQLRLLFETDLENGTLVEGRLTVDGLRSQTPLATATGRVDGGRLAIRFGPWPEWPFARPYRVELRLSSSLLSSLSVPLGDADEREAALRTLAGRLLELIEGIDRLAGRLRSQPDPSTPLDRETVDGQAHLARRLALLRPRPFTPYADTRRLLAAAVRIVAVGDPRRDPRIASGIPGPADLLVLRRAFDRERASHGPRAAAVVGAVADRLVKRWDTAPTAPTDDHGNEAIDALQGPILDTAGRLLAIASGAATLPPGVEALDEERLRLLYDLEDLIDRTGDALWRRPGGQAAVGAILTAARTLARAIADRTSIPDSLLDDLLDRYQLRGLRHRLLIEDVEEGARLVDRLVELSGAPGDRNDFRFDDWHRIGGREWDRRWAEWSARVESHLEIPELPGDDVPSGIATDLRHLVRRLREGRYAVLEDLLAGSRATVDADLRLLVATTRNSLSHDPR